ncbi:MAG: TorF family putative porin [Kiritimatiellales bacterium]
MKKLLAATVIAAGVALAQQNVPVQDTIIVEQKADVAVIANVDLFSAYVWRGQVVNDSLVAQPAVTIEKAGFFLDIWANYNIVGKKNREDTDFTKVEFTLGYKIPVNTDDFDITVGLTHFTFPESEGQVNRKDGNDDWEDTTELFISSTFYGIILNPTVEIYYDCDQAQGWYGSFGLSHTFELSDALNMTLGGSIGLAEAEWAREQYGESVSSGWNDYNAYVAAEYALTEDLTLGARLQYSVLDGSYKHGKNKDGTRHYDATDNLVWGGISLSYKF